MKKIKLITSCVALTGLTATIAPLTCLTSCSKKSSNTSANLMEEFNPTIEKLAAEEFAGCLDSHDIVNKYLDEVESNQYVFRQDMLYTLSRGLTVYNQKLKDAGVSIKKQSFNALITNVIVNRNASGEECGIFFDLEFKANYKYSADVETLKQLGIYFKQWNGTVKYNFYFDFSDKNFTGDVNGLRRLLTAGTETAEIGISEVSSVIGVESVKGTCVNLEGSKVKIQQVSGDGPFITPQQDYWSPVEYQDRLSHIDLLKESGHYLIVDLLNNYLGTSSFAAGMTPNTINLGSYHMGNLSLESTFEFGPNDEDTTCYGFSFANNAAKNLENLTESEEYDNYVFTLPTKKMAGDVEKEINKIGDHAFDATLSENNNFALPDEVLEIVIPSSYTKIGDKAFAFAKPTSLITKLTFMPWTIKPYSIGYSAFYQMPNLQVIDFSYLNIDAYKYINNWNNAFEGVHEGYTGEEQEGTIYLPEGWNDDAPTTLGWVNLANSLGIHCWYEMTPEDERVGWHLV